MRISITGATGFVGRALLAGAATSGHERVALTRRPPRADTPAAGLRWVRGTLEDEDALARLVEGADLVIHLAGLVKARRAQEFFAVNEQGTARLLRAMERAAAPDARLLLVSSLAAREAALGPYGASKRAGERVVEESLPPARWTILRPPALYGPGDREMLPLWRAAGRGLLPAPGGARQRISLLHVADLVRLIEGWCAPGTASRLAGRIFEIDDGHGGYDCHELADVLSRVWKRRVRVLPLPRAVVTAAAHAGEGLARLRGRAAMLSRHKLPELLHPDWAVPAMDETLLAHWRPRIPAEEGIRRTLQAAGLLPS